MKAKERAPLGIHGFELPFILCSYAAGADIKARGLCHGTLVLSKESLAPAGELVLIQTTITDTSKN
jgi:hypothetical protein